MGTQSPVHERSTCVFAGKIFRVSTSIASIVVDAIVVHAVVARSTTADRGRPCERGDFIARDAPRAGGRARSRDRRRGVDAIRSKVSKGAQGGGLGLESRTVKFTRGKKSSGKLRQLIRLIQSAFHDADPRERTHTANTKTHPTMMISMTHGGLSARVSSAALFTRRDATKPGANSRVTLAVHAKTNFVLDKPGCASARSDDTGALHKQRSSQSKSCLTVPIDVDALGEKELEFEDADVKFHARERDLEIVTMRGTVMVDGKKLKKGKKMVVKAGSKLVVGDEELVVYRNTHAHA